MKRAQNTFILVWTFTVMITFSACSELTREDAGITLEYASDLLDVDGNANRTLIIGNQVWTAGNLNVSHFRNGDPIMQVSSNYEWFLAGRDSIPAWRYYNDDPSLGEKFGKLYNAFALADARGLAPEGWRVPNDEDWNQLFVNLEGDIHGHDFIRTLDPFSDEGDTLSLRMYHWKNVNPGLMTGLSTETGHEQPVHFGAVLGGFVDYYGNFFEAQTAASWWTYPMSFSFVSPEKYNSPFARVRFKENRETISLFVATQMGAGYSVRLIKE